MTFDEWYKKAHPWQPTTKGNKELKGVHHQRFKECWEVAYKEGFTDCVVTEVIYPEDLNE